MNPDIYVIEPLTWVVLAIVALLVVATVALWLREAHGPDGDGAYADWRREDVRKARETRDQIATMRTRMAVADVHSGSMRKYTRP